MEGYVHVFFGLVHGNDVILVLGLSICIGAVEDQRSRGGRNCCGFIKDGGRTTSLLLDG